MNVESWANRGDRNAFGGSKGSVMAGPRAPSPTGSHPPCPPVHDRVNVVTGEGGRSEEHTSELQSRGHLVCRLLLEKKNKIESTDTNKIKKKNNSTNPLNPDTT